MPGGMPGIPGGTIPLSRFPMARPLFESKENSKHNPNFLGAHGPRLGSLQDLQQMEILQAKKMLQHIFLSFR